MTNEETPTGRNINVRSGMRIRSSSAAGDITLPEMSANLLQTIVGQMQEHRRQDQAR